MYTVLFVKDVIMSYIRTVPTIKAHFYGWNTGGDKTIYRIKGIAEQAV